MKKLSTFLLVGTLVLSVLSGCEKKDNENTAAKTELPQASEITTVAPTEVPTEETTVTPTTVPTTTPTTKPIETTKPNDEVVTTKPIETDKEKPAEKPKPTEPPKKVYTYTDCKQNMVVNSAVNVRSGPSTDFDKLGNLTAGKMVKVTGVCKETGWYRIEFNGGVAYVSDNYLSIPIADDEPETPKPTEKPTEKPTPKPEPEKPKAPADYSKTAIYDYFDERVQEFIKVDGVTYPTVDYSKVPVVDIDSMITPDKFGPNCSGLSNLSTPWSYEYDPIDVDIYLTWNKEIPMNQYIIWNGVLGFIYRSDDLETRHKLNTTDFAVTAFYDIDNLVEIHFGTFFTWSDGKYDYVFRGLKNWK